MNRVIDTLVMVVLTALLAACATTYHSSGFTGGYSDAQIDSNTYKVLFKGNGYTSRDRVETYLMYRCAELTAQAGFDYFVILDGSTDTRHNTVTTPGSYTSTTTGSATVYGNTAYGSATTTGTFNPGQTLHITKYGGTALIKVFKGDKPPDDLRAFVAKEVIQYLGPNIKK